MDRFWSKVDRRPDGCWEWTAYRNRFGYGRFGMDGEVVLAHRVAYEMLVGPIPDGLSLDHLCRNRGCVRPDHLEPVTAAENVLRGTGWAGRNARKTHCPRSHPLAGDNLMRNRHSQRLCRECARERNHAAYWANREQRTAWQRAYNARQKVAV